MSVAEYMAPETVICPYCQNPAVYLESSESVYHGRDYGPMYRCEPCDAHVGVHPGTTKPLGRMANKELREWKMRAHAAFDPIWQARFDLKRAQDPKYTRGMARGGRYKKLAGLLGIERKDCHIGHFDVDQCKQVIAICQSGALEDKVINKRA